jgi:hypothetical protein
MRIKNGMPEQFDLQRSIGTPLTDTEMKRIVREAVSKFKS